MGDGISITFDVSDLAKVNAAISRLSQLDETELLTEIGALGESQTRRRIESEKTSPEGAPWLPNKEGTSILLRTGNHLRDSIAFNVLSNAVEWGSSWEFAHVHQNGATIVPKSGSFLVFTGNGGKVFARKAHIPTRPFVGLSAANSSEIEDQVTDFLARQIR